MTDTIVGNKAVHELFIAIGARDRLEVVNPWVVERIKPTVQPIGEAVSKLEYV